jgi:hypothetical protein
MLGSLLENVRVLSSAFQPETNTRFSAVIVAQVHQRLDNPELEYKYHFIPNPFARYPVGMQFERLFLL